MVGIFEKILGEKLDVVYYDLPKDDPRIRKPDITLAMEKLNWNPIIDLDIGIKKMVENYLK